MSAKAKVLVVDDEPAIQDMFQKALNSRQFQVRVTDTGKGAIQDLHAGDFDLVFADVYLPDINGLELLREVHKLPVVPGVVVITGHSSVTDAVVAMKRGAFDYLEKPFTPDQIELLLERYFRFRNLEKENSRLKHTISQFQGIEGIVGKSQPMLDVFETIKMVAPTNSTILIQGESGTGKELIARAIHQLSQRSENSFIRMNCAAVPEPLVESELFGHEKGAFTGAIDRKEGRFKAADHGTILLDEISEMGLQVQAKLLRVLQEREFEPLGSVKTQSVDVRVIATTNRKLQGMVKEKKFREDLYYRLNVVPIHVRPLRDRKDDIPHLVSHFVRKTMAVNGRRIEKVDPSVYQVLEKFDWPGNVRQLENAIERAIVTSKDDSIDASHFDFLYAEMERVPCIGAMAHSGRPLREIEKTAILETLKRERGNRTRTAEVLEISVRTLRNKLREYRERDEIGAEYARWVYDQ